MNNLENVQVKEAIKPGADEAGKRLSDAVHTIEDKQGRLEKAEVLDLGTGDKLYRYAELSERLDMKNGDSLHVGRKGGKIIGLKDKAGNQIAVPGDSENIAPPDSPMEMYRLSNGALYIKDNVSGDQILVNKDGSRVVIDNEGIHEVRRDHTIVGFGRKLIKGGTDHLEAEDIFNPAKK